MKCKKKEMISRCLKRKRVQEDEKNEHGVVIPGKCSICFFVIDIAVRICHNNCNASLICLDCMHQWKGLSLYETVPCPTSKVGHRLRAKPASRKCVGCRGPLRFELYSGDFYRMLGESLNIKKFQCKKCEVFTCDDLRTLVVHHRDTHNCLEVFHCPRCQRVVPETPGGMIQHMEQHCTNLICPHPKCNKSGITSREMSAHRLSHRCIGAVTGHMAIVSAEQIIHIKTLLDSEEVHRPNILDMVWKFNKHVIQLMRGWDKPENWEGDTFKFKEIRNQRQVASSWRTLLNYTGINASPIPTICQDFIPNELLQNDIDLNIR